MGIVEEVGSQVQTLKKGQRVVIPFNISCGHCHFCLNHMESQCDESNPDQLYGGLFGFGKLNGNHWGGQAEYLRVPYADSTSFVVPDNVLPDEKVLFLSDILPTAYWSVENAGVKKGDTVVILGSGPVGLFAQKFAVMAGAERVIAVDPVQHRLDKAANYNGVETYFLEDTAQAGTELYELAKGGADVIIDCVGMDGLEPVKEKAKNLVSLQSGTISPLQMASQAVKKIWNSPSNWCLYDSSFFLPAARIFYAGYRCQAWTGTNYPSNAKNLRNDRRRTIRSHTNHYSFAATIRSSTSI